MLNEVKISGLKPTDRVFKCGAQYVKIRLEAKEVVKSGNILGPSSISMRFTVSVCDKKGKAIPLKNGRFCVFPHTVTVPLMDMDTETGLETELQKIIEPLAEKAVRWHRAMGQAETFVSGWQKKSAS